MSNIYRIAGRYETTNPELHNHLQISKEAIEDHIKWFQTNTNSDSPFQKFLRLYFGNGLQLEQSLNRFALTVELVKQYCPNGGSWVDEGSFCHDAILLKILRPDIDIHLATYEGCIIYLDEKGLHYYDGNGERPEISMYSQPLDIEREKLTIPSESIDLVTSFEVLEHLKYSPGYFMLEVNRLLKPNGWFVLTTPNATSALAISSILRGMHPALCPLYHRNPEYGRIHPLEYAKNQLSDLAISYGFDIDLLASINMIPFDEVEKAAMKSTSHANEFGMHWLLIAKKTRPVLELQYPASIFE